MAEQIGWFIGFKGHQEFYGIDGDPFEFDWNVFPGHTALQQLQRTPIKMVTRGIKPEDFRDRIIFTSMYGDIGWSRGEENFNKCQANSTEVRKLRIQIPEGTLVFSRLVN